MYRIVSENYSFKNSRFDKECMAHKPSCHPAISQLSMADISFNIAFKELRIAQIAQVNQLFQLLNLVQYGHGFYELNRMLMRKNVNNDASKDSPFHT